MKSAITLTAFNRPDCLSRVVSSILNNDTSGFDTAYIAIEKERAEDNDKAVMPLLERFNCVKLFNKVNKGVRKNPFDVLEEAFKENDFVFYLEDDQILSPDAFDFIRHFQKNYKDKSDVLCACLYNYESDPSMEQIVHRYRKFCALGVGIFKEQWEKYFRPHWFDEDIRVRQHIDLGGIGGWDWSIRATMKEFNLVTVTPAYSRSFHIGVNGIHCEKSCYDSQFANHPFCTVKVEDFFDVNITYPSN